MPSAGTASSRSVRTEARSRTDLTLDDMWQQKNICFPFLSFLVTRALHDSLTLDNA